MSDFAIVLLKQEEGPCVLCDEKIGFGLVGWFQGYPPGPVCDACMLDRERLLGDFLMTVRAIDNGPVN